MFAKLILFAGVSAAAGYSNGGAAAAALLSRKVRKIG